MSRRRQARAWCVGVTAGGGAFAVLGTESSLAPETRCATKVTGGGQKDGAEEVVARALTVELARAVQLEVRGDTVGIRRRRGATAALGEERAAARRSCAPAADEDDNRKKPQGARGEVTRRPCSQDACTLPLRSLK